MKKPKDRGRPNTLDDWLTGRFKWATVAAAVLLGVATILPVLWSAFYADDAWRSVADSSSFLGLTQTSIVQKIFSYEMGWISGQGRFFPLSGYAYLLFYLVNGNAFAYKAFIMVLVAMNLFLFGVFVGRLTHSPALRLLAILAVPLTFQVRYADDPLTTYQGLMQVVVLCTLAALIALIAYIDTKKIVYLVAGVVIYAASLLTYEVGLPLFIMFFLVAYLYPRRRRALEAAALTWPFAAAAVMVAALSLGLRLYFRVPITGGAGGSAYAPNLDVFAAAGTLLKQTTAAIPLIYNTTWVFRESWGIPFTPLAQPLPGFFGTIVASPIAAVFLAAGFGALLTLGCVAAVREGTRRKDPAPSLWALVAFGVCMLILPGVLVSLSPKYQADRWIRWGVPYIPIYASDFGMAALLVVGLYVVLRRTRHSSAWKLVSFVAVALGVFIAVANYGNTASVIAGWEPYYVFTRQAEQSALSRGIMGDFPDGGALMGKGLDWEADPGFFGLYGGKTVGTLATLANAGEQLRSQATTSLAPGGGTTYSFGPAHPLHFIDYAGKSKTNGYAVYGSVTSFVVGPDGTVGNVMAAPTRVYLSWDPPGSPSPSQTQYTSPAVLGLDPSKWTVTAAGDNWALYRPRSAAATSSP